MEYRNSYISPLGRILLTADEIGLTGLAFEGQKNAVQGLIRESEEKKRQHFFGCEKMAGYIFFRSGTGLSNTDSFGRNRFSDVCVEMLCTIPYGETTTYGAIAKQIAHDRGISKMSSQAVGNAIGRNPVSVIVPCHRVIEAKRKSDRICRRN